MCCFKGEGFFDYVEINQKKFKNKNLLGSLTKNTRSNSKIC